MWRFFLFPWALLHLFSNKPLATGNNNLRQWVNLLSGLGRRKVRELHRARQALGEASPCLAAAAEGETAQAGPGQRDASKNFSSIPYFPFRATGLDEGEDGYLLLRADFGRMSGKHLACANGFLKVKHPHYWNRSLSWDVYWECHFVFVNHPLLKLYSLEGVKYLPCPGTSAPFLIRVKINCWIKMNFK